MCEGNNKIMNVLLEISYLEKQLINLKIYDQLIIKIERRKNPKRITREIVTIFFITFLKISLDEIF